MNTNRWTLNVTIALTALLAPLALGCYRATGFDRATVIAEEMPVDGGDRVPGLKSMAGAGDYYIGNDFVNLAVDGTPPHIGQGIAGAPGGGSIIDVGFVMLDTSFRRVPAPCDMLDRMTTVVNQDPEIQIVFNEFKTFAEPEMARLQMSGRIHDPGRKLGAPLDGEFIKGAVAVANISLGTMDRHFTLETTITNNGPSAIGVRNIGDFLYQRGGGFRVLAPVCEDFAGDLISTWGVDMPGTDFSNPLQNSVRSGMIALMGTEPGSDTLDCHVSLGLMPLDADQFLVACDPQSSMAETRPIFPKRFIAGGMAGEAPLGPGETITHSRRLYVKGGTSGAMEHAAIAVTQGTPNQGTGVINEMYSAMALLKNSQMPKVLRLWLEDTGARLTPVPSELRFERYTYTGKDADPATDVNPLHWKLERLEWMEPADSLQVVSNAYGQIMAETPNNLFGFFLPEGTYRIVSSNPSQKSVFQTGTNRDNLDRPSLQTPITLGDVDIFYMLESVCPEYDATYSPYGSKTSTALRNFTIGTRGNDSIGPYVQPMRFTFMGRDGEPSPNFMRTRRITSTFNPNSKQPRLPAPPYSAEIPPGAFHFLGGGSAFGAQMADYTSMIVSVAPGTYDVYGARGPLSTLERFEMDVRPGLGESSKMLTVFTAPNPDNWIAFDVPGPSMATSGGTLPCEQLASALAEGLDIVAVAETDCQTDSWALYKEFKQSLNYTFDYNRGVTVRPLTIDGRRSDLVGHGAATALFTPVDPHARLGGARPSVNWTLADFLKQAEGKYNIVNRPRGPQGLFTVKGFNPALPLPQAAPWWDESGLLSVGAKNGDFDALEILNAGTIAESGIGAWWQEFKATRDDWFSLLSQQSPVFFTKALGFSGGRFSQDTPVGLVRTWLNIKDTNTVQDYIDAIIDPYQMGLAVDAVMRTLKEGAAVVSSGPMLIVCVKVDDGKGGDDDDDHAIEVGPGGLATIGGSPSSITLDVTLVAPDWMPVDEIRVVVNGKVAATLPNPKVRLSQSDKDSRYYTGKITVPVPTGKDAWLVAEAGAPLNTSGTHHPEAVAWNVLMKGIYPVAVANPIFLDLDGRGYVPPGL